MNNSHQFATILSLPASVSETEAFREFHSTRLSSMVWRLGNGKLLRIAPLYLPFGLYRLQYELGRTRYTRFVALDHVEGVLDLFEFPVAFSERDLLPIETRNKIGPTLSHDRAEYLLREKAMRLVFQEGFFRLRHSQVDLRCIIHQFHIPYWLGF